MLLEEMLDLQQGLVNKGKSVDEIRCAAVMLTAAETANMTSELQRISEQLSNIEANTRGTD